MPQLTGIQSSALAWSMPSTMDGHIRPQAAGWCIYLCYHPLNVPQGMRSLKTQPHVFAPHVIPRHRRLGRCQTVPHAGIKARWCIDVRYGTKLDAVVLMQEWVRDIASQAGLSAAYARLNSGSVGIPESRLELEVEFDTFSELEDFWARIPPQQHQAWSQRMQGLIVHGSPTWEIYRTVPLLEASTSNGTPSAGAAAPTISAADGAGSRARRRASVPGSSGLLQQPTAEEIAKLSPAQEAPFVGQTTDSGLSIVTSEDEAQVVLDWKGDPMKVNPGDKLPFKFF